MRLSVTIEDTTVVIKRQYIDSEFPGGTTEFARCLGEAFSPTFIADSDPSLVRVGFATPEEARDAAAWLCRSTPGFRDEPEAPASGLLPIASGNGIRISLDLSTGREVASETEPGLELPMPTPLHAELLGVLAESGWRVYSATAPEAMVDLLGSAAVYTCRYFAAEDSRTLVCTTRCPVLIPETARGRAMQFITRANFGMFYGSFELDLDDGILLFRTNCAVCDGALTTDMVKHMASAGAWSFDRYLPRLLEVVFGKRRVRDAVSDADAA
jgi:hypothetical protein